MTELAKVLVHLLQDGHPHLACFAFNILEDTVDRPAAVTYVEGFQTFTILTLRDRCRKDGAA